MTQLLSLGDVGGRENVALDYEKGLFLSPFQSHRPVPRVDLHHLQREFARITALGYEVPDEGRSLFRKLQRELDRRIRPVQAGHPIIVLLPWSAQRYESRHRQPGEQREDTQGSRRSCCHDEILRRARKCSAGCYFTPAAKRGMTSRPTSVSDRAMSSWGMPPQLPWKIT